MTAIGAFVATRWEMNAVSQAFPGNQSLALGSLRCVVARCGSTEWWIIPMGVGPERATQSAQVALSAQEFAAVWSTGFAGAMRQARIGDVLVGRDVVTDDDPGAGGAAYAADAGLVAWAQRALATQQLSAQVGRFVSVGRVICRAEDKKRLAVAQGAIGLDMESAALALVASRWKIPFAIVRTVSDLVDEDLPLDFNLFLRPSEWVKGIAACLAHPTSLLGLNRLRVQSRLAGEQLTAVFRAFAQLAAADGIA